MTASIIQLPSRGGFIRRENAAYESATVAGERMACITPQRGQNNLARKIIVARMKFETPLSHSLTAGKLERGARVIRCASLTFSARGNAEVSNWVRPLAGWSVLRALQPLQKSKRCVLQTFHLLLNVLRHGNHHGRRSFVSVQKDFGEVRNV